MQFFCSLGKVVVFLALSIVATTLHGQDGWDYAAQRLQSSQSSTGGLFAPSLVAADFNHDGYPDGALLLRSGDSVRIEVYLRSDRVKRVFFTSNRPDLAISVVDVNQDGSPDLVVEDPFWHQRLFVWLNDGSGKFSAASVADCPPAFQSAHPRTTGPLTGKECSALAESSRVRSGHAVRYLDRQLPVLLPSRFIRESGWVLALSDSAPNFVRGPPVPSHS